MNKIVISFSIFIVCLAFWTYILMFITHNVMRPENYLEDNKYLREHGTYRPLQPDSVKKKIFIHDGFPDEVGMEYKNVSFSLQGQKVHGWHVKGRNKESGSGIVFLHGAHSDMREGLKYLPFLTAAGYSVLLIDQREYGLSTGTDIGITLGRREHVDVGFAAMFAKEELGFEKVFLFGSSQGAASSIIAATKPPFNKLIDGVIAENPFCHRTTVVARALNTVLKQDGFGDIDKNQNAMTAFISNYLYLPDWLVDFIAYMSVWRMDIESQGRLYEYDNVDPCVVINHVRPRPLLILHGTEDVMVPHSESGELMEAALEPKKLVLFPGSDHGMLWNEHKEVYEKEIIEFLKEWSDDFDEDEFEEEEKKVEEKEKVVEKEEK